MGVSSARARVRQAAEARAVRCCDVKDPKARLKIQSLLSNIIVGVKTTGTKHRFEGRRKGRE